MRLLFQLLPDLLILLFFSIGLGAAATAFYLYQSRNALLKNGNPTPGIVVDLIRSGRRAYTKAPAIQYTDARGQVKMYYHPVATNPPDYYIGEEVMLYINPKNPDDIILARDNLMIYVAAGFGAVFLLLSVWSVPGSLVSVCNALFGRGVPG